MKRSLWYGSAVLLVLIGLIVFAFQRAARPAPERLFWDMVGNNLSTAGVTRTITAQSDAQKITQYTQLQLGPRPLSHSLTIASGPAGTVQAEEVSDQKTDMVRYRQISTTQKAADGKALDFSSVTGKWAALDAGSQASGFTAGLFDATLLGIMPFGNLPVESRQGLVDYARSQNVFTFDAAKVARQTVDGKSVYTYDVSVRPAAYVSFMQRYGKLVGADEFAGQDANDYQTAATIPLSVSVDPLSRQLVSIVQKNTQQTEKYSGYGTYTATTVPTAQISLAELQSRLSAIRR